MNRFQFTFDESFFVFNAPGQVVTAMLLAEQVDPVAYLREIREAFLLLMREAYKPVIDSELVAMVAQSIQQNIPTDLLRREDQMQQYIIGFLFSQEPKGTAEQARKEAIASLQQMAAILEAKVDAAEAKQFKTWLLYLATRVAGLVAEGEVAWERVSGAETAVIQELQEVLKLNLISNVA